MFGTPSRGPEHLDNKCLGPLLGVPNISTTFWFTNSCKLGVRFPRWYWNPKSKMERLLCTCFNCSWEILSCGINRKPKLPPTYAPMHVGRSWQSFQATHFSVEWTHRPGVLRPGRCEWWEEDGRLSAHRNSGLWSMMKHEQIPAVRVRLHSHHSTELLKAVPVCHCLDVSSGNPLLLMWTNSIYSSSPCSAPFDISTANAHCTSLYWEGDLWNLSYFLNKRN